MTILERIVIEKTYAKKAKEFKLINNIFFIDHKYLFNISYFLSA